MDLTLTEEQEQLRALAREWVDREITASGGTAVDKVAAELGSMDVLVNNNLPHQMSAADWDILNVYRGCVFSVRPCGASAHGPAPRRQDRVRLERVRPGQQRRRQQKRGRVRHPAPSRRSSAVPASTQTQMTSGFIARL
jgi:hypothetical protein